MKLKFLASAALMLLATVLSNAQNSDMKNETSFKQIFPQGEPLPQQFSQYFIGQAYLAPISDNSQLGTHISNVTFEPACRNNWHSHTGGQLLIVTAGRGYYQEKGKAARELRPGDVVEIPANVVHWHGAAPDNWFSHLAVECNTATNKNTWLEPVNDAQYAQATAASTTGIDVTPTAKDNLAAWYSGLDSDMAQTDPELAEIFANFAFDDVMRYGKLDARTRILVSMACTIAQNTATQYGMLLPAATANGISPLEIREVLYHAVPYVGMAKVADMLKVANEYFGSAGISLPLEPQSVVTRDTRFEKGLALQKELFGAEHIDAMYDNAPENQIHIQKFLSANCFGDYQTRPVFDARMRELLTFAMLISLGGCEPQVKGHINGNLRAGNDKNTMLAVATQLLSYNGYPRTLNAIACLNEVIPENR